MFDIQLWRPFAQHGNIFFLRTEFLNAKRHQNKTEVYVQIQELKKKVPVNPVLRQKCDVSEHIPSTAMCSIAS